MNKDDYLDKKIPEGSGEPDNFTVPDTDNPVLMTAETFQQIMDEWWEMQDKDEAWSKKTEKELF